MGKNMTMDQICELWQINKRRGGIRAEVQDLILRLNAVDKSKKKKAVTPPVAAVTTATPNLDHYFGREVAMYVRIRETYGVNLTWPLDQFAATLQKIGAERIALWEGKYGLRIGTIPDYAITPEAAFPPVKPRAWFYDQVAAGKVGQLTGDVFVPNTEAFRLRPAVVLFDPRQKPAYKDGKQMWVGDEQFLGGVITRLRQAGTLQSFKWCSPGSRFGISPNDWEQVVKPALTGLEDFVGAAWQLEPAAVWSFLSQAHPDLPRVRDGETSTWVFFEEYFEGAHSRLSGGSSDHGGLASVFWDAADFRLVDWSPRPLGVLA